MAERRRGRRIRSLSPDQRISKRRCRSRSVSLSSLSDNSLKHRSWPFSEPADCSFPSCTSKWDVSHLESLRIFYDGHSLLVPNILDMVYKATGMYKPLSDAQKKRVKQVQNSISFSSTISELILYAVHYYCTLTGLADPPQTDVFEESIVKNLEKNTVDTDDLSESADLSLVQLRVRDFITSTLLMIQIMRSTKKPVPEALFVDLFKDFVKMCGLIACDGSVQPLQLNININYTVLLNTAQTTVPKCPKNIDFENRRALTISDVKNLTTRILFSNFSDGSAWKAESEILQNHMITSETDVVIARRKTITESSLGLLTLVSIFGAKNLGSYQKEEEYRRSTPPSRPECIKGGATNIACEEPEIYRRMGRNVLGQHGGEILIHFEKFENDIKKSFNNYYYRPGMIVSGTEVTLTLLVCSFEHWNEIVRENVVGRKKSIIYYSEPKDLLKKEERDLLIESFVRLNNTT